MRFKIVIYIDNIPYRPIYTYDGWFLQREGRLGWVLIDIVREVHCTQYSEFFWTTEETPIHIRDTEDILRKVLPAKRDYRVEITPFEEPEKSCIAG